MRRLEELGRTVRNLRLVTDLLRSMGDNTENVFDIEDNMRDSPAMAACAERVRAIPEARMLMEARYLGPEVDLAALLQLPPHSLGRTYAEVLNALGFDPNFYRRREIASDSDWVTMRLRKCHDIIHVVSGFGPTGGELGVLSIQAVQIGYPMSVMLQTAALGLALRQKPEQLPQLTDQMARGMAIGREAAPFIAQRWEEGWERPLAEWRASLGITNPVISEPYSLKNRLPGLAFA
ncbi:Coq4 family protein [Gloeobacter morelensis]|uniref:Ubiquinone biosynthesis protein n=1 Tax=Gloeobacter morelensis MG652769 TaxID=2781736 RepID=A0ABY3PRG3_9CYAN|nr:Coq4 family protein [Gloeobacter morelensis]UFP96201.1 ubiquinone biosynthesis protein [Gloeobacter morelensis MG652769]